jgi:putative transposase
MLVLSKIGRIPIHWSRPLEGIPTTVTISREADGWYASFSCVEVPAQPLPRTGKTTGIDLGLNVFLVRADGSRVPNPRYYRKAEKESKKAHRCVSRRKIGSNRRKKAVACLARKHQTVRRKRPGHHHKTALNLVREYDTVYYENLTVANLMRNRHLSKSIRDAAWGGFLPHRRAQGSVGWQASDCGGAREHIAAMFAARLR